MRNRNKHWPLPLPSLSHPQEEAVDAAAFVFGPGCNHRLVVSLGWQTSMVDCSVARRSPFKESATTFLSLSHNVLLAQSACWPASLLSLVFFFFFSSSSTHSHACSQQKEPDGYPLTFLFRAFLHFFLHPLNISSLLPRDFFLSCLLCIWLSDKCHLRRLR